jgi:hypothetical protein
MDWNAIALGLEAAAETTGLNALDYVPDDLPNTAMYVGEMEIDPNITFGSRTGTRRGTDQGTITCRVLVARSTDKYAIRKMRQYMAGSGVKSLIQAFQADKTLGGSCSSSKVARISGNRLFNVGEAKFYGCEIDVFVIGAA